MKACLPSNQCTVPENTKLLQDTLAYLHYTWFGVWLLANDISYIIGQCTHACSFYFTNAHHYNYIYNTLLCLHTTKYLYYYIPLLLMSMPPFCMSTTCNKSCTQVSAHMYMWLASVLLMDTLYFVTLQISWNGPLYPQCSYHLFPHGSNMINGSWHPLLSNLSNTA